LGLSPELFKRLSRLNRQLVGGDLATGDQAGQGGVSGKEDLQAGAPATLEEVIPGQVREVCGGRLYVVLRQVEAIYPGNRPDGDEEGGGAGSGAHLVAAYQRTLFGSRRAVAPADLHEAVRPLVDTDPAGIAYLDIETCGLMGEPLFLIGFLRWDGTRLQVEQFLARDYAEERFVLMAAWEKIGRATCLVTFNGKTFDMPTIETRSLVCGLFDRPQAPVHVDLLFEARRRWKRVLPNCKLQTIEQLICGRHRHGDIPGSDIPAAYHEFVRAQQGDDAVRRVRSLRQMQAILHHNALDLVTMAELVTHLVGGTEARA
jgi:uncharacterized protein YprB with RNaseH-like and TPR domain